MVDEKIDEKELEAEEKVEEITATDQHIIHDKLILVTLSDERIAIVYDGKVTGGLNADGQLISGFFLNTKDEKIVAEYLK